MARGLDGWKMTQSSPSNEQIADIIVSPKDVELQITPVDEAKIHCDGCNDTLSNDSDVYTNDSTTNSNLNALSLDDTTIIILTPRTSKTEIFNKNTNIHNQVKRFSISLDANNTLSNRSCGNRISNTYVIAMTIFSLILFFSDKVIGRLTIVSILGQVSIFITLSLAVLRLNEYIIKQALRSFMLYYKCFHILIASIARMIYFNFWITIDDANDSNNSSSNSNGFYITSDTGHYIHGIIFVIDAVFLIFVVSCFDGYYTKSNTVKRVALICTIFGKFIFGFSIFYFSHF